MTDNWHESLFSGDNGDSLGDGTWGTKASGNEPALTPVAWDKIPEQSTNKKKVRARLATPAPGSRKESGLLDIRALAEGMRLDGDLSLRPRKPTPAPKPGPARLATAAKASNGSGLIDVAELARLQREELAAKDAHDEEPGAVDQEILATDSASLSGTAAPILAAHDSGSEEVEAAAADSGEHAEATASTSGSASASSSASAVAMSSSSLLSSSLVEPEAVAAASVVAPIDEPAPSGSSSTVLALVGVAALAVAGLAVFVLGG